MKKDYYTWGKIERGCKEIADQLKKDGFVPDYIVGITRGGAIPAILLSNLLKVPMRPLEVSLRDSGITTSAGDMAEDALGYFNQAISAELRKKILIVDDINDSGDTLNWIKNDWEKSAFPGNPEWASVWHNTVKFATVINNTASDAVVDYSSILINKMSNPAWIVFPWEEF
jgi:hypoxanthine phosphoribosyltransferase